MQLSRRVGSLLELFEGSTTDREIGDKLKNWWRVKPRSAQWLWLAIPALAAGFLGWTAPIHELCHAFVVFLTGGMVTSTEYDNINWINGNHDLILFFGYGGEVVLYTAFSMVSRRLHAFWMGLVFTQGVQAMGIMDFANFGPAADYAVVALMWVCLVGCAFMIWRRLRRRGAYGRAAESTAAGLAG
jgi:hypothetical protein